MNIYASSQPEVVSAQEDAVRAAGCAESFAEWWEAERFALLLVYGEGGR